MHYTRHVNYNVYKHKHSDHVEKEGVHCVVYEVKYQDMLITV